MEVDAQLWLKQNNVILATSIFEWLKEFFAAIIKLMIIILLACDSIHFFWL